MSEKNTQKKIVKWNNKNKSGARDREEKIQRTNIIQFSISLEKYFVATHIFCKSIETFSFSSKWMPWQCTRSHTQRHIQSTRYCLEVVFFFVCVYLAKNK